MKINEYLNNVTDGLGKNIDKGIINTVYEINRLGFMTNGSCEGHLNHGTLGPWVDIAEKGMEAWYDEKIQSFFDKQIKGKISEEEANKNMIKQLATKEYRIHDSNLLKEKKKIQRIIDDYYSNKNSKVKASIKLNLVDIVGIFRIESSGNRMAKKNRTENDVLFRREARKEMRDFTKYLKTL